MRKTRAIQMKSIGTPDPVAAGAFIVHLMQKEKSLRVSMKGNAPRSQNLIDNKQSIATNVGAT